MADFLSSYKRVDEPELSAAIARGEIQSYKDIIAYFADKPVVGAEEYTRLEYVRENMEFDDNLPPVIVKELQRIVPGLCAQESKFNNGLTSAAGAKGIFHLCPRRGKVTGGSRMISTRLENR
jgi:hypothetical protein